MFIVAISVDDVKFKNYFSEGRLRVYANLQNAVNGSKQLLKNPKNNIKVVRVLRKEDNVIVAIVKKTNTGYSVEELKTSESLGVKSLPKALPAPDIKVERKDNTQEKKVTNKSTNKQTVPITDLMSKDARLQLIKDTHEKWQEKKKNTPVEVKAGGSTNNLSLNKEDEKTYRNIMADLIETSIDKRDIQTLFKLEVSLSQKGYSWYPKDNENIAVDKTEKVIDLLNKKEI